MKINTIASEVEINKSNVLIGDNLYYVDACNSQKWTVTELFDGGFMANDGKVTNDFSFDELQYGWELSAKAKARVFRNGKWVA